MKGVQCYELFGGIALKNHTFSFFSFTLELFHKMMQLRLRVTSSTKQRKLVMLFIVIFKKLYSVQCQADNMMHSVYDSKIKNISQASQNGVSIEMFFSAVFVVAPLIVVIVMSLALAQRIAN